MENISRKISFLFPDASICDGPEKNVSGESSHYKESQGKAGVLEGEPVARQWGLTATGIGVTANNSLRGIIVVVTLALVVRAVAIVVFQAVAVRVPVWGLVAAGAGLGVRGLISVTVITPAGKGLLLTLIFPLWRHVSPSTKNSRDPVIITSYPLPLPSLSRSYRDYKPTKPDKMFKGINSKVLLLLLDAERHEGPSLPPAARAGRGIGHGGVEDVEGETRGGQEGEQCPVREERRRGGVSPPAIPSSTATPPATPVLGPVTEGPHHVGRLPVVAAGAVVARIVSITPGLTTKGKIHSPGLQARDRPAKWLTLPNQGWTMTAHLIEIVPVINNKCFS